MPAVNFEHFEKIFNEETKETIKIIRSYGFDLRVVGGAVRDLLLHHTPNDIDLVTPADPAELIYMFNKAAVKFDASGIQHGTVKAVFGDEKVDVSCLNYHLRMKDGRLRLKHTRSWRKDALGRDLTINSMSIDVDGQLYDYCGGLYDIENQIIRFCPHAVLKIEDDPNTIMRWFRAMTYFDKPKITKHDLRIVEEHIHLVDFDDERTEKAILSIKKSPNKDKIAKLMNDLFGRKVI